MIRRNVLLMFFLFLVTLSFAQVTTEVRNVNVDGFQSAMDSVQDEVIIDLRTPEELKQGRIATAQHIDFFSAGFEPAIAKLNKDKIYFLYCASGGRSGETVEKMRMMGFKKLYNLEGGFRQWVAHKKPVVKR